MASRPRRARRAARPLALVIACIVGTVMRLQAQALAPAVQLVRPPFDAPAPDPSDWARPVPARPMAAAARLWEFPIDSAQRTAATAQLQATLQQSSHADAAQLGRALTSARVFQVLRTTMQRVGLRDDNLADALTIYWVTAWVTASDSPTAPEPRAVAGVRLQVLDGLRRAPQLRALDARARQQLADQLLVQTAVISVAASLPRSSRDARAAVATAVGAAAQAARFPIDGLQLSAAGLLPSAAGGGGAASATAAVSTPGVRGPTRTDVADALLTTLDQVPAAHRPQYVSFRTVSTFVGYPPVASASTTIHLLFPTGYATSCNDWDPARLSPTPSALGRARPDCELQRWRATPAGVELQSSDGSWSSIEVQDPTIRRFSRGQRLSLSFGNVRGMGFAGVASTLDASELRMSAAGELAIGQWSTTVVSGPNFAGSAERSDTPLMGRYALDGYLMAVQSPGSAPRIGFAIGVGTRALEHLWINGVHFWKPDE